MELSIIIPTKDRKEIFYKTLKDAYCAIADAKAEIIVVNDSKTDIVEIELLYRAKVTLFNNPKSGVASARNFGAAQAEAPLLLFLDDDMLINADNIATILQLHQTYKNCCINLNWVYPPQLSEKMNQTPFGRYLIHYGFTSLKGWNRGEVWDETRLFVTNGITSQCLSMEKSVFMFSGGYNETFPHAGFEDFDFAQRLKQKGILFYIYPLSIIFHNEQDRVNVHEWLQRKKRGGETRKVAVLMGYSHVAIKHTYTKRKLYQLLVLMQPFIKWLLTLIPAHPQFDFIYFRIINILLGVAIFEGYQKK